MASGTFDYMFLTGNFDFQTGDYPAFESSTVILANFYPDTTVNLNQIYGYENLNTDIVVGLELIA